MEKEDHDDIDVGEYAKNYNEQMSSLANEGMYLENQGEDSTPVLYAVREQVKNGIAFFEKKKDLRFLTLIPVLMLTNQRIYEHEKRKKK